MGVLFLLNISLPLTLNERISFIRRQDFIDEISQLGVLKFVNCYSLSIVLCLTDYPNHFRENVNFTVLHFA